MTFSARSICIPLPAISLFAILTFGGSLAVKHPAVPNVPDMDLVTVGITATLDGAPMQLGTEIARIIEERERLQACDGEGRGLDRGIGGTG